jgi:hypothetical protein
MTHLSTGSAQLVAPIALFVYNRPEHTRRTIEALRKNILADHSELIIFSDGAKNAAGQAQVEAVRAYCATVTGFRTARVVCRERNYGLARSIVSGVTEVLQTYEQIIVLEDDLVTSPYFLQYMNEALELYAPDDRVVSIHGYCYPIAEPLPDTFFLRGADCLGWGTWKRGWKVFEPDGRMLLRELQQRGLRRAFDLDGAYPYTQMLKSQILGFNDSWAVRWYAAAFLAGKLTLYPGCSLVLNIGMDNTGTHSKSTQLFSGAIASGPIPIQPVPVEQSTAGYQAVRNFFRQPRLRVLVWGVKIKFYIRLLCRYARIRRLSRI